MVFALNYQYHVIDVMFYVLFHWKSVNFLCTILSGLRRKFHRASNSLAVFFPGLTWLCFNISIILQSIWIRIARFVNYSTYGCLLWILLVMEHFITFSEWNIIRMIKQIIEQCNWQCVTMWLTESRDVGQHYGERVIKLKSWRKKARKTTSMIAKNR